MLQLSYGGEPPGVLGTMLSGLLIANELMTVIIPYNNWYLWSVYTGFISALQMLVFITNCCTAEFGGYKPLSKGDKSGNVRSEVVHVHAAGEFSHDVHQRGLYM